MNWLVDFYNNLSNMSKIYIIEIISLIVLVIILGIISHVIRKKKEKKEALEHGLNLYFEKKKKLFLLPIIVLFLGALAITLQYVFEKPQVDSTINVNVFSEITADNYKVMYHNKNIFDQISGIKDIDTTKTGDYTFNITIPYLNNSFSQSVNVKVADMDAPEITTEYADGGEVSYTVDLTKNGFSANDNYDQDITSLVSVNTEDLSNNKIHVSYAVSDSSGNTTTKNIILTVIDDVKPEITLKGSSKVSIKIGDSYTDEGATATDEKDGDLSANITTSSNINYSVAGSYKITYSVSDNSGNQNSIIRLINVYDPSQSDGVIYLTFDDGPSSSITPHILDILQQKGVKATFFILNYSDSNEYLIKREANEGHSIGIHGYSHTYSQIYTSVDAFMKNITSLREKIKASTGVDSTIMRFPGGSSNTVSKSYCTGIMTALTKKVLEEGYKYYDWNVSSGDAGGAKSSSDVYNNVIKELSKSHENIVLMHDFSGNTKTLNALASIIDYGLTNGYRFSNITPSTPMVTHKVNN